MLGRMPVSQAAQCAHSVLHLPRLQRVASILQAVNAMWDTVAQQVAAQLALLDNTSRQQQALPVLLAKQASLLVQQDEAPVRTVMPGHTPA